ncbi:MAG: glycosyltransferase family 4 protein [bacterium]|nr:glycosyltransferase family 4 protein [bacterium]
MRIAHITNPSQQLPPKGDRGRWLLVTSLIREQIRRGHEVTVFGNSKTNIKGARIESLDPLTPDSIKGPATSARMLKHYTYLLLLNRAYRHIEEFDILHSHLDNLHFFMSSLVDKPTLMTQHWPIEPLTQNIVQQIPFSNVYITPISKAQTKHYKEKIQYTDVVYNGIDVNQFKFNKSPQDHFVFIGRLHPSKGVHHAINVCKKLRKKLILAGSTDLQREIYRNYWEKKINPALKSSFISYRGELPHQKIAKFVGQAKALLFPIEWEEPFGLVMVEAMATGTPVIAFNKGSVPELVKDGVTGFVVKNEDEMRDAIKKIDTIDRAACREWVKNNFSIERMGDGYEQVYKKLIKQHEKKSL